MTRHQRIGLLVVPLLILLLAGGGAVYAARLTRPGAAVSAQQVARWREFLGQVEKGDRALPPANVAAVLRMSLDAAEAERALSMNVVELAQALGMMLAVAGALQVYLVIRVTRQRRPG